MSSTENWGSFNESVDYPPGNNGWIRPSAPQTAPAYLPQSHTGRNYANNRWPPTENWSSSYNVRPAHVPRPFPYQPNDPWWLFENRVRTGPYTLNGFPMSPLSPMRIISLGNNEVEPEVNPRLRQFIQESPPRIRGQWNMQPVSDEEEESSLTKEEQKKALKKLKKQVYDPYPKTGTNRWSLYYRDNTSFRKNNSEQDNDDDDGKSCAICLENFVPKQEVLVTPCNHMFHSDCIVKWIKSNGRCPVCRFTLGEKKSGNVRPLAAANDPTAVDLLSLIRAMEEAFEWVNVPR